MVVNYGKNRKEPLPTTKAIDEAFDRFGWKHKVVVMDGASFVDADFSAENCSSINVRLISMEFFNNGYNVKASSGIIASVPESQKPRMCMLLNNLNYNYYGITFYMDNDGAITANYDFACSIKLDDLGRVAEEVTVRLIKVVDDTYPIIINALR